MEKLESLAAISDRYQLFLIDIWGVLHNGFQVYPEAVKALEFLKAAGKQTVLLSNSPRRLSNNIERLEHFGIPRELYTEIFTSGEYCHQHLRAHSLPEITGQRYYFMGSTDDLSVGIGLDDYNQVTDIENADFILCIGTQDGDVTLDPYQDVLVAAAKAELPLLCVNPDLEVNVGPEIILCAGAIAALYESLGGRVRYFGKPFPDFYQSLLQRFPVAPTDVLAIGDAMRTDILGAHLQNIDSLLVLSGLSGAGDCHLPFLSPVSKQQVSILPTYVHKQLMI